MRGCLLALALALVAACGPVAYVHQVTFDADDAVAAARRAHADKYSPYWFTRATLYLGMAHEVAGHADYQGANRFGRLAAEAARKAEAEAELGATDPSKLPYLHLDAVAPAKEETVAPAKDAPATAPIPAKDAPAVPAKDAPAVPAKDAPATSAPAPATSAPAPAPAKGTP